MPAQHIGKGTRVTADEWWNPLTDLANQNEADILQINQKLASTTADGGISDISSRFAGIDTSLGAIANSVKAVNWVSDIANPSDGDLALVLQTGTDAQYGINQVGLIVYRYVAADAIWKPSMPAGGLVDSEYAQSGSGQSIPNSTQQRVLFDTDTTTTPFVTKSAGSDGGSIFTLNYDGAYTINTGIRYLAGGSAAERTLMLGDGQSTNTRYVENSEITSSLKKASVSIKRRFSAGESVAAWTYQASGAALALDTGFNTIKMYISWDHG